MVAHVGDVRIEMFVPGVLRIARSAIFWNGGITRMCGTKRDINASSRAQSIPFNGPGDPQPCKLQKTMELYSFYSTYLCKLLPPFTCSRKVQRYKLSPSRWLTWYNILKHWAQDCVKSCYCCLKPLFLLAKWKVMLWKSILLYLSSK